MLKVINPDNLEEEIEVYTAEELQAKIEEKETEKAQIVKERDEARVALGNRTAEFGQFRKLNDGAKAKLSEAEKLNYENSLLLHEQLEKNKELEKNVRQSQVDSILRAKVGNDDKLFQKAKETWNIININAETPDEIDAKSRMVLGALGIQDTNPVASVGNFSGGYLPPGAQGSEGKTFADTDRGRAAAAELGIVLEVKK